MKINLYSLLKHSFWIIISISIIISIFLIFFLYNNLYKTIAYTKDLHILKSKIAIKMLDMKLYEEILNKLKKKKEGQKIEWEKINNPFIKYQGYDR